MSDNIPFDIQMEIIKWLPVKPLIQFRLVSKPWKSFIDTSKFIKGYGARNMQPHSFIESYRSHEVKYGRLLVEDDKNETFKVEKQELAPAVVSPLFKQFYTLEIIGASHGLLCLQSYTHSYTRNMLVIWNPSIGKSFGIAHPNHLSSWSCNHIFGFGVCPNTSDPTVVKIIQRHNKPWHVEVFTLSSGIWNVIPSSNLLYQSVEIISLSQVVIDRFIYWVAYETPSAHAYDKYKVVSFDLITKEFKLVHLPDSLACKRSAPVGLCKLRESLVVYGSISDGWEKQSCDVWMMEHDSSFRKLFSIGTHVAKILGFMESGEPILSGQCTTLVYDPHSLQIKNLGIPEVGSLLFMESYNESLLLLDHSDLHVYSSGN